MALKKYTRLEVDEHIETLNKLGYSKATAFNAKDLKRLLRRSAQIIKQLNRRYRDYS
jgi:Holliday junction resolvasome RuvABC DNA-binding subunit